MAKPDVFESILESLKIPIVFVNTLHHLEYMNEAGQQHYARFGNILGKSVFDCHKPESRHKIEAIYAQLQSGADEVLYFENEKQKIYMRGVRDSEGKLIGYYERYEDKV